MLESLRESKSAPSANDHSPRQFELCTPKSKAGQLVSGDYRLFVFMHMRSLHSVLHHFWCNRWLARSTAACANAH